MSDVIRKDTLTSPQCQACWVRQNLSMPSRQLERASSKRSEKNPDDDIHSIYIYLYLYISIYLYIYIYISIHVPIYIKFYTLVDYGPMMTVTKYCKLPYIHCCKILRLFSFRLFVAGNFCGFWIYSKLGLLYWYPIIYSRQNEFANLMPLTNLVKILCSRKKGDLQYMS